MASTRLRYISNTSPDELYKTIELLPIKVEIKNVALGRDGKWYAWFTIMDFDSTEYGNKKKVK